MKNIGNIFIWDLKKIRKNVIALIVIMGLSIVPSLYAWFNIAASWDPYANTGKLKVAVANTDVGYKGDLLPLKLNFGETILSTLRADNQLDWQFVSQNRAVNGVKSGEYYAAIVIPETFSQDMMSLFSNNIEKAEILYYLNEKENAIAPKVTDKGSSAVRRQVDEIFAKTVTAVGVDLLDTISRLSDQENVKEMASRLSGNLRDIAQGLDSASGTLTAFSNMTGAIRNTLDTTSAFLSQSGQHAKANLTLFQDAQSTSDNLSEALSQTADSIDDVLTQGSRCYEAIAKQVNESFSPLSQDTASLTGTLNGLSEEVQVIIDHYTEFRDSLEELAQQIPESSNLINPIIGQIDETLVHQKAVQDKLKDTGEQLHSASDNIAAYQKELTELAKKSADSFSALRSDYNKNLKNKLSRLFASLDDANASAAKVLTRLCKGTDALAQSSATAVSDLGVLEKALNDSAGLLDESSAYLNTLLEQIEKSAKSGSPKVLEHLVGEDPETISSFIAAPVEMKEKALYPVENYGSAMTPFYSTLAIWVGGIILAAMLKVSISEKTKQKLSPLKDYQLYFGRHLIFLAIGLAQTTLICLGDLYYLNIQCQHPFYFLLAGWISSIVYVNIIYTLTVSFGDIGKAISVILLVMQVAGSGGTFPIEMAPGFFQKVYPLLPFTHSMQAMRECIGGFYGSDYWIELGILLLYLIPSLFLGLVLRKPLIRFNQGFMERLEDTKLM